MRLLTNQSRAKSLLNANEKLYIDLKSHESDKQRFFSAIYHGNLGLIKWYMQEHGFSADTRSEEDSQVTALNASCFNSYLSNIVLFFLSSEETNINSPKEHMPLYLIVRNICVAILINDENNDLQNDLRMFKIFLSKGADISVKNYYGKAPLEIIDTYLDDLDKREKAHSLIHEAIKEVQENRFTFNLQFNDEPAFNPEQLITTDESRRNVSLYMNGEYNALINILKLSNNSASSSVSEQAIPFAPYNYSNAIDALIFLMAYNGKILISVAFYLNLEQKINLRQFQNSYISHPGFCS